MFITNQEPEKLVKLKTYEEQYIEFIYSHNKIRHDQLLKEILETLTLDQSNNFFLSLRKKHYQKYVGFLIASKKLSIVNKQMGFRVYGFESKTEKILIKQLDESKISLSTGDYLAFLIRKYFYYNSINCSILKPVANNAIIEIIVKLKQNTPLVRTELEGNLYLSLANALYVFFIYQKEKALNKFKNIILKDLKNKNFKSYQFQHNVTLERFFKRINLSYIPRIDTVNDKNGIIFTKAEKSINQSELLKIIDKEDFFNRKPPLQNYPADRLINISTDVKDFKTFSEIISKIFKKYACEKDSAYEYDLGKVFLENISEPYPQYSPSVLIEVREILKEIFKNSEFKKIFFCFIFLQHSDYKITSWVNKFPNILNSYLGGMEKYSVSSIKKHFYSDGNNPVNNNKAMKLYNDFMEE